MCSSSHSCSAPRRASACSTRTEPRRRIDVGGAVGALDAGPARVGRPAQRSICGSRQRCSCRESSCEWPPYGLASFRRATRRRAGSGSRRSSRRGRPPRRRRARFATSARRSSPSAMQLVDRLRRSTLRGRAPRSTTVPSASCRSPWCTHCQTWARQISAVAASSIRSWIGTQPGARRARRRCSAADVDVGAKPGSVIAARRAADAEQVGGRDVRRRGAGASSWFGVGHVPRRTRRARRHQVGVRDPGAVEAVARLALLVVSHLGQGRLGHLGLASIGDERRHAADRVRAALVAGPDQQLGVRAHERHRHRHLRAVRQHERRVGRGIFLMMLKM